MLYKINGTTVKSTNKVNFSDINISERDIENWVEETPGILGEPLKIIGRQLRIEEVGDRLDLLAFDIQGNLVVIELKSDIVKSEASLQAIKYTSYLSNWEHEQIDKQMGNYLEEGYDFIEEIENFCEEDYEINKKQRIILAGREIRPRTSSVVLWLRKQGVDIKIVQLEPWQDGEVIYLNPRVLIPLPAEEEFHIDAFKGDKSRPWKEDGKDWHLHNRCSTESAELLLSLIDMVEENWANVQGPNWGQKSYVSFKIASSNWIYVRTHASNLRIQVRCNIFDFDIEDIANKLGIIELEDDISFNNVELANEVKKWNQRSRIVFRLKPDFELTEEFRMILDELKQSFEDNVL